MIKRILKDIDNLVKIAPDTIIDNNNIVYFTLEGPKDSIYENGKWVIRIEFPKQYPYKSPSVGFITKIYHPNVDFNSGTICLNVLNKSWTPIYNLTHIYSIFLPQLLMYPNANDPLNIDSTELFLSNIDEFNKNVIKNINKYCINL
jgi:ubiquitin-protein ligase